jgi:hypothetical protein
LWLEKVCEIDILYFCWISFNPVVIFCLVIDEVSSDVFDLLLSMGDFTEFKELMLSHKRALATGDNAAGGGLELCGHNLS